MQKILLLGLAFLILLGGYFYFTQQAAAPIDVEMPSDATGMPITGTVTDVDVSQLALDGPAVVTIRTDAGVTQSIAIPSMGIRLCEAYDNIATADGIAVGDVLRVNGDIDEEGRIVPCEDSSHFLEVLTTYTNEEIGFAFQYEAGRPGYVFEDDLPGFSEHPDFVYGIMLTDTQEYEAFHNSTDAREGPPTIQIRVIENTQNLSPSVWAMRNPLESNIEMAFNEPDEAVVGGANAIHYVSDGLFAMETYVVAHGDYIFVIVGMLLDMEGGMAQDFEELVDSFTFIPTAEQLEEGGA